MSDGSGRGPQGWLRLALRSNPLIRSVLSRPRLLAMAIPLVRATWPDTSLPGAAAWRQERTGELHRRQVGNFAIALLDLDHFKSARDTSGHRMADLRRKQIAHRMASCVRPYDTVGSDDGEEFIMVAASRARPTAAGRADRVLTTIRTRPIESGGGRLTLAASRGISIGHLRNLLDPRSLMLPSVEALYRAKAAGRTRAEFAVKTEFTPLRSRWLFAPEHGAPRFLPDCVRAHDEGVNIRSRMAVRSSEI
jgi:diguanylate cyclase (GGDEF)-like protein